LVVCGGVDKELKIIDTRMAIGDNKGVAWCTKNAHDRPIRDAKFNPFLPYWLASAGKVLRIISLLFHIFKSKKIGEDAIVNIWDVRGTYHAPVAKIDGHSSVVASVNKNTVHLLFNIHSDSSSYFYFFFFS
jgi:WD40 repeat protein